MSTLSPQDLRRRLSSGHRSIQLQALNSLVILLATKPPDHHEAQELLKLLWESIFPSSSHSATSAFLASKGMDAIVRLVKIGRLTWMQAIARLLNGLEKIPQQHLPELVRGCAELLVLHVLGVVMVRSVNEKASRTVDRQQHRQERRVGACSSYVCPFNIKTPRPHPFSHIATVRPEAWPAILFQLKRLLLSPQEASAPTSNSGLFAGTGFSRSIQEDPDLIFDFADTLMRMLSPFLWHVLFVVPVEQRSEPHTILATAQVQKLLFDILDDRVAQELSGRVGGMASVSGVEGPLGDHTNRASMYELMQTHIYSLLFSREISKPVLPGIPHSPSTIPLHTTKLSTWSSSLSNSDAFVGQVYRNLVHDPLHESLAARIFTKFPPSSHFACIQSTFLVHNMGVLLDSRITANGPLVPLLQTFHMGVTSLFRNSTISARNRYKEEDDDEVEAGEKDGGGSGNAGDIRVGLVVLVLVVTSYLLLDVSDLTLERRLLLEILDHVARYLHAVDEQSGGCMVSRGVRRACSVALIPVIQVVSEGQALEGMVVGAEIQEDISEMRSQMATAHRVLKALEGLIFGRTDSTITNRQTKTPDLNDQPFDVINALQAQALRLPVPLSVSISERISVIVSYLRTLSQAQINTRDPIQHHPSIFVEFPLCCSTLPSMPLLALTPLVLPCNAVELRIAGLGHMTKMVTQAVWVPTMTSASEAPHGARGNLGTQSAGSLSPMTIIPFMMYLLQNKGIQQPVDGWDCAVSEGSSIFSDNHGDAMVRLHILQNVLPALVSSPLSTPGEVASRTNGPGTLGADPFVTGIILKVVSSLLQESHTGIKSATETQATILLQTPSSSTPSTSNTTTEQTTKITIGTTLKSTSILRSVGLRALIRLWELQPRVWTHLKNEITKVCLRRGLKVFGGAESGSGLETTIRVNKDISFGRSKRQRQHAAFDFEVETEVDEMELGVVSTLRLLAVEHASTQGSDILPWLLSILEQSINWLNAMLRNDTSDQNHGATEHAILNWSALVQEVVLCMTLEGTNACIDSGVTDPRAAWNVVMSRFVSSLQDTCGIGVASAKTIPVPLDVINHLCEFFGLVGLNAEDSDANNAFKQEILSKHLIPLLKFPGNLPRSITGEADSEGVRIGEPLLWAARWSIRQRDQECQGGRIEGVPRSSESNGVLSPPSLAYWALSRFAPPTIFEYIPPPSQLVLHIARNPGLPLIFTTGPIELTSSSCDHQHFGIVLLRLLFPNQDSDRERLLAPVVGAASLLTSLISHEVKHMRRAVFKGLASATFSQLSNSAMSTSQEPSSLSFATLLDRLENSAFSVACKMWDTFVGSGRGTGAAGGVGTRNGLAVASMYAGSVTNLAPQPTSAQHHHQPKLDAPGEQLHQDGKRRMAVMDAISKHWRSVTSRRLADLFRDMPLPSATDHVCIRIEFWRAWRCVWERSIADAIIAVMDGKEVDKDQEKERADSSRSMVTPSSNEVLEAFIGFAVEDLVAKRLPEAIKKSPGACINTLACVSGLLTSAAEVAPNVAAQQSIRVVDELLSKFAKPIGSSSSGNVTNAELYLSDEIQFGVAMSLVATARVLYLHDEDRVLRCLQWLWSGVGVTKDNEVVFETDENGREADHNKFAKEIHEAVISEWTWHSFACGYGLSMLLAHLVSANHPLLNRDNVVGKLTHILEWCWNGTATSRSGTALTPPAFSAYLGSMIGLGATLHIVFPVSAGEDGDEHKQDRGASGKISSTVRLVLEKSFAQLEVFSDVARLVAGHEAASRKAEDMVGERKLTEGLIQRAQGIVWVVSAAASRGISGSEMAGPLRKDRLTSMLELIVAACVKERNLMVVHSHALIGLSRILASDPSAQKHAEIFDSLLSTLTSTKLLGSSASSLRMSALMALPNLLLGSEADYGLSSASSDQIDVLERSDGPRRPYWASSPTVIQACCQAVESLEGILVGGTKTAAAEPKLARAVGWSLGKLLYGLLRECQTTESSLRNSAEGNQALVATVSRRNALVVLKSLADGGDDTLGGTGSLGSGMHGGGAPGRGKDPPNYRRLNPATSYLRAIFETLSAVKPSSADPQVPRREVAGLFTLIMALKTVEQPLPPVDWQPVLEHVIWTSWNENEIAISDLDNDLADRDNKLAVLALPLTSFQFASKHAGRANSAKSLVTFFVKALTDAADGWLVSRGNPSGPWFMTGNSLYRRLWRRIVVSDEGVGKLVQLGGLQRTASRVDLKREDKQNKDKGSSSGGTGTVYIPSGKVVDIFRNIVHGLFDDALLMDEDEKLVLRWTIVKTMVPYMISPLVQGSNTKLLDRLRKDLINVLISAFTGLSLKDMSALDVNNTFIGSDIDIEISGTVKTRSLLVDMIRGIATCAATHEDTALSFLAMLAQGLQADRDLHEKDLWAIGRLIELVMVDEDKPVPSESSPAGLVGQPPEGSKQQVSLGYKHILLAQVMCSMANASTIDLGTIRPREAATTFLIHVLKASLRSGDMSIQKSGVEMLLTVLHHTVASPTTDASNATTMGSSTNTSGKNMVFVNLAADAEERMKWVVRMLDILIVLIANAATSEQMALGPFSQQLEAGWNVALAGMMSLWWGTIRGRLAEASLKNDVWYGSVRIASNWRRQASHGSEPRELLTMGRIVALDEVTIDVASSEVSLIMSQLLGGDLEDTQILSSYQKLISKRLQRIVSCTKVSLLEGQNEPEQDYAKVSRIPVSPSTRSSMLSVLLRLQEVPVVREHWAAVVEEL
ncbi:hypothetical protein HK102_013259 [Quaeritorhiza haematococci]|nr:hypothetical protein HK102_013259 [Quaeritorhiza haematococci]